MLIPVSFFSESCWGRCGEDLPSSYPKNSMMVGWLAFRLGVSSQADGEWVTDVSWRILGSVDEKTKRLKQIWHSESAGDLGEIELDGKIIVRSMAADREGMEWILGRSEQVSGLLFFFNNLCLWRCLRDLFSYWSKMRKEAGLLGRVKIGGKKSGIGRGERAWVVGVLWLGWPRSRAVLGFMFMPPSHLRAHMLKSGWNKPLGQPWREKDIPGDGQHAVWVF